MRLEKSIANRKFNANDIEDVPQTKNPAYSSDGVSFYNMS